MPGPQQIRPDVLATAQQVARRLFLLGRHVDRGQRAGSIQHGELPGITPIGRDAIARPPRNQRWGNDVAGDIVRLQRPLQFEPARAGLIAAAHHALPAQSSYELPQLG